MPVPKAQYARRFMMYLSPSDHQAALTLANVRGVSLAALIREALAAYMAQQQIPVGR